MVQFDGELTWSFVMAGLARDVADAAVEGQVYAGLVREWLSAAAVLPKNPAG
jgi:hypothetical protein